MLCPPPDPRRSGRAPARPPRGSTPNGGSESGGADRRSSAPAARARPAWSFVSHAFRHQSAFACVHVPSSATMPSSGSVHGFPFASNTPGSVEEPRQSTPQRCASTSSPHAWESERHESPTTIFAATAPARSGAVPEHVVGLLGMLEDEHARRDRQGDRAIAHADRPRLAALRARFVGHVPRMSRLRAPAKPIRWVASGTALVRRWFSRSCSLAMAATTLPARRSGPARERSAERRAVGPWRRCRRPLARRLGHRAWPVRPAPHVVGMGRD